MSSTFANLASHIIFGTKQRDPLIAPDNAPRLYSFVGGIVRNRRCVLLAAGGMPNHVHLLISFHPTVAPADMVRDAKANSSRWMHEEIRLAEF